MTEEQQAIHAALADYASKRLNPSTDAGATGAPPNPATSRPTSELQLDLDHVEGRDLHLWSIALVVALTLAAGICGLLLPKLIWNTGELRIDSPYLPQFFFGFIALMVLFNAYVCEQRSLLKRVRNELTRQLLRANAAESVAQIDPLTETLNRRWMESTLHREIRRTDRLHGSLTLMMVDVDEFKAVNTRFGHLMGDRLLQDVARILKKTFRACDSVFRYGGDEFLVIMGDTNEQQAQVALDRLQQNVDRWNEGIGVPGWKLSLSAGYFSYKTGMCMEELISTADRRMYDDKNLRRAQRYGVELAESKPHAGPEPNPMSGSGSRTLRGPL
ncbi:MAG TPA: GGDEF domain-containing protein [Terriglobales bacterium]|nr:GGDEF domain-containing protein [Terriglobales bacterium]